MQACFISIAFCFIISSLSAQTILDVKKDFGAMGNGKTDDTKAFLRAVDKINSSGGNVTLNIPTGNYLLNPQRNGLQSEGPFRSIEILYFKNCRNIKVLGTGAKLTFKNDLYYGAFEKQNGRWQKYPGVTTNYNYLATIGHGIKLENCSDINISNIEIDGNNKNFITGGQFGDVGFQVDNDGIFIQDSRNITLTSLNIHHFGRDGLQIINKTPQGFNTPYQDITLTKCRFEYNGRQGFSWTGGVGLTATDCNFGNTGKSKFVSPPGAGIDFEPNAGYIVYDGKFYNCTISNNEGIGVLADAGSYNARKMYFSNCFISGSKSAAIWIKSPEFVFENCKITGTFYFGYAATKPKDGTQFLSCTFKDNSAGQGSNLNYLIESNGAQFLLFDKCTFNSSTSSLIYVASGAETEQHRAEFRSCSFEGIFSKNSSGYKNGMFTTGTVLTGNCVFTTSGERIGWNMENTNIGIKGQTSKIIIGRGYTAATYVAIEVGKDNAQASLIIEDGGALVMNRQSKLLIGGNGKIIIKKGGTLLVAPSALLAVKGSMIAEQGSHFCIHPEAVLDAASLRNIKVSKPIIYTDNPAVRVGASGCRTF